MAAPPSVIPVKVYVRARPSNKKEKAEGASDCLDFNIPDNQISCTGKAFTFDNVLDQATPQDTAYEVIAAPLLEHFFKGFNCTILAYGQTGSGKTYTMGTEETKESMKRSSRGIIPRLVDDLFKRVASSEQPACYKVTVSMLEIYDEKIHDILSGNREKEGLQAREVNGSVYVQGLSTVEVRDLESTMAQLEHGCQLRSKGETAMNATSSRSHAIFTITMEKLPTDTDDTNFVAKLHLVDLAGSERLKKTQAEGNRMKEGIRINEGLLALGNVISALSEPGSNSRHIPYRDSKITRLLQDSLGGNSFTVMIACVSPADTNAEETISTLRYADRAKKIKNKPTVTMDPEQKLIKKLKEENATLKREIAELRSGVVSGGKEKLDETSHSELTELRAKLAENEKLLADAKKKAAEVMVQRIAMNRQLIRNEEEKKEIKSLALTSESCTTFDELQPVVRRIFDIVDAKVDPSETRDMTREASVENELDGADTEDDENADEAESRFCTAQFQLNQDLTEIQDLIRQKENEMQQQAGDQEKIAQLLQDQKAEMEALQLKMDKIIAEKNKATEELKKFSNSSKLSEERRKKLLEMEKQLARYRSQMNAFKRLEKQKAQSEENLKRMQAEMQKLKTDRVRKEKQSREEAKRYHAMEQKMKRKVATTEMAVQKERAKMARLHQADLQKMAVLKAHIAEAHRVGKNLSRQTNRDIQLREEGSSIDSKTLRNIKTSLGGEVALILSSLEALKACDKLVAQRKRIAEQSKKAKKELNQLKDEPAAKKRRSAGVDGDNALPSSEDEKRIAELTKEIEELEQKQVLCSTELSALQSECNKFDAEARKDQFLKNIHTVNYAKAVLRVFFDVATEHAQSTVDMKSELAEKAEKIQELKEKAAEEKKLYLQKLDALTQKFEEQKKEDRDRFSSMLALCSTRGATDDVMDKLESMQHAVENTDFVGEVTKARQSLSTRQTKSRRRESRAWSNDIADEIAEENIVEGKRTTHATRRFGDPKNTLTAVKVTEEDETFDVSQTSNAHDSSYHPYAKKPVDAPVIVKKATRARKASRAPVNISPIWGDKEENGEKKSKRRGSRLKSVSAPSSEERTSTVEKMDTNEPAAANTTFCVDEGEKPAATLEFPEESNENVMNGTFVKAKEEPEKDENEMSPRLPGLTRHKSRNSKFTLGDIH